MKIKVSMQEVKEAETNDTFLSPSHLSAIPADVVCSVIQRACPSLPRASWVLVALQVGLPVPLFLIHFIPPHPGSPSNVPEVPVGRIQSVNPLVVPFPHLRPRVQCYCRLKVPPAALLDLLQPPATLLACRKAALPSKR